MAKKSQSANLGHYAFLAGVILALVLGIAKEQIQPNDVWITSLIVVLGLIVGFMNVSGKSMKEFMMAGTVLIIASYAGSASTTLGEVITAGPYLSGIFEALLALLVPAVVVVGLRDTWELLRK